MNRSTFLVLTIAACDPAVEESPTLAILAPADGEVVAAGDVPVSVVVEHFELVVPGTARVMRFDPTAWLSPVAWAHGDEATARGWIAVSLDDATAFDLSDTQGVLTGVTAGPHNLSLALIHEDGDAVEPAVTASITFTAE